MQDLNKPYFEEGERVLFYTNNLVYEHLRGPCTIKAVRLSSFFHGTVAQRLEYSYQIDTDPSKNWWREKFIRKYHEPCNYSFDELMLMLKAGDIE